MLHGVRRFVKRRDPAEPGSIPDVLGMFTAEVRFYREIAPHIGVRVPVCYEASEGLEGTLLVLEDLSDWSPGADPVEAVHLYAELHGRFRGVAARRWPWLRRGGDGADLVGALYDRTWPMLAGRPDLPASVRRVGAAMVGHAAGAERASLGNGPVTLVHGDASARNQRTGPSGEIALLDWEDVRLGGGIADIGWFLVSSVGPDLGRGARRLPGHRRARRGPPRRDGPGPPLPQRRGSRFGRGPRLGPSAGGCGRTAVVTARHPPSTGAKPVHPRGSGVNSLHRPSETTSTVPSATLTAVSSSIAYVGTGSRPAHFSALPTS